MIPKAISQKSKYDDESPVAKSKINTSNMFASNFQFFSSLLEHKKVSFVSIHTKRINYQLY